MQYDDAFTIQKVDEELVRIFNHMAGMVPFVQKLIADVRLSIISITYISCKVSIHFDPDIFSK